MLKILIIIFSRAFFNVKFTIPLPKKMIFLEHVILNTSWNNANLLTPYSVGSLFLYSINLFND